MKAPSYWLRTLLIILVVAATPTLISSCTSTPEQRGKPALKTGGEISPPPGCQDLRQRGGAC